MLLRSSGGIIDFFCFVLGGLITLLSSYDQLHVDPPGPGELWNSPSEHPTCQFQACLQGQPEHRTNKFDRNWGKTQMRLLQSTFKTACTWIKGRLQNHWTFACFALELVQTFENEMMALMDNKRKLKHLKTSADWCKDDPRSSDQDGWLKGWQRHTGPTLFQIHVYFCRKLFIPCLFVMFLFPQTCRQSLMKVLMGPSGRHVRSGTGSSAICKLSYKIISTRQLWSQINMLNLYENHYWSIKWLTCQTDWTVEQEWTQNGSLSDYPVHIFLALLTCQSEKLIT